MLDRRCPGNEQHIRRTLQQPRDRHLHRRRIELNPLARIAELRKRRADIDADMTKIREGHLEPMEPIQVRERFLRMATTARELLFDFRALDQNFRSLDRGLREQIATWERGRACFSCRRACATTARRSASN